MYSVVTNSTYDGLCYNARRVEELLDPSVDRIHFDEAWYAYARFNPLYRDRHAMHGDPKDHKGPTIFATHSTHKLLAALSQASFLHIRDGRGAIPHSRFNESFMMQASTSPLYPIIVSNDITAAMMDGPGGPRSPTSPSRRRWRSGRPWAARTGSSRQEGNGSSRPGMPNRQGTRRQEGALRGCLARAAGHRSAVLGAASRGDLARLQRSRRRLLHARSDQGVDRHARRRRQGRPRQDAASRRRLVTEYLHYAASKSRRPPTSRSWSCSRSASPRASGARCSTRCSISSATTTATRRSSRRCRGSPAIIRATYGGMGLRDLADQMFAQLEASKQTHWLAEAFSTLPEPRS